MELTCAVQRYAWGKPGLSSAVASLQSAANPDFSVVPDSPYAELWMGTHVNGPSMLASPDRRISLKEYIAENPSVLGEQSRTRFGEDGLPFLFKVLSVNKALSIQTHPDKDSAKKLHLQKPDVYKDPNHKPELAVALTRFEGLCGFRPLTEIQSAVQSIPQLANVMGGPSKVSDLIRATKADYQAPLKTAFTFLMTAPEELLTENLASLEKEVRVKESKSDTEELFLRLLGQYPGDVGCFVAFLLNYLILAPGEAMFLAPNLIHCYLSGDCIECMACSDNVVRAGLTPKLIDAVTLCELLRYDCAPEEEMKFQPTSENASVLVYNPPVDDFAVAKVEITEESPLELVPRVSASIILVVEGGGTFRLKDTDDEVVLKKGKVFFLAANEEVTVKKSDPGVLKMFQAFC